MRFDVLVRRWHLQSRWHLQCHRQNRLLRNKLRKTRCYEYTHKHKFKKYWWNIAVKISIKCIHNRLNIAVWHREAKVCPIREVICPADINIPFKIKDKEDIYGQLLWNLQPLYPDYEYRFMAIIIEARRFVIKFWTENLHKPRFLETEIDRLIRMLQVQRESRTVKICKTFLKFRIWICLC